MAVLLSTKKPLRLNDLQSNTGSCSKIYELARSPLGLVLSGNYNNHPGHVFIHGVDQSRRAMSRMPSSCSLEVESILFPSPGKSEPME